ncbi:hypothetical protein MKZ20_21955 [Psychrobacillus sp. FSL K6-2684]|uniref:hypothetical protein n=1 Tax=unclassified Psychrobacillus TaxID=2636677 RepID=UPI0030F6E06E
MAIENEQYEERVIVFIDILGFREHINLSVKEPDYFIKLRDVLNYISSYQKKNYGDGFRAQKDIGKEVTVFSDSVVISYPVELPGSVYYLLMDIIYLQLDMLQAGILFRGGVTVGKLCHDDNIVYGPAMNEAYELESKVAVYPRVIVSEKVIKKGIENPLNPPKQELEYIASLLKQDFDEQYYIDFMSQWQEVDDVLYFDALSKIKIVIEKAIEDTKSVPNVKAKYQWLKRYYNSVLDTLDEKYTKNRYID